MNTIDGPAYFAVAVSYDRKMFMKFIKGPTRKVELKMNEKTFLDIFIKFKFFFEELISGTMVPRLSA